MLKNNILYKWYSDRRKNHIREIFNLIEPGASIIPGYTLGAGVEMVSHIQNM